jgi:hypothetical protein
VSISPTAPMSSPAPSELGPVARWTLILGGIALAAVGLAFWIWPVDHTKPAPDGAECRTPRECFVKVDDAPELLLSTLVVLGALLTLVGVNNRSITKFSGPGGTGFETAAPKAADEAEKKTAEAEPELNQAQLTAAKLLAPEKARAETLQRELLAGRRLTDSEVDRVASEAAAESVETVRGNPTFE